jgi:tetratricopeptide (TPR) repeat protein
MLSELMENLPDTRPSSPRSKLDEAIHLAKSGQRVEACRQLRAVVALQPVNQAAWLWLSAVTAEEAEAKAAFAKAKQIDPNHPSLPRAEQWLSHRYTPEPAAQESDVEKVPADIPPDPRQSRYLFGTVNALSVALVGLALLIGLIVFLLGLILEADAAALPTAGLDFGAFSSTAARAKDTETDYRARVKAAVSARDWTAAIKMMEQQSLAAPNSLMTSEALAEAYLQRGLKLRGRGFVEESTADFERVLEILPHNVQAQRELDLAADYKLGIRHYQAGRWEAAISKLEQVWTVDSRYTNVRDLLYSGYYNHGLALHAAGELSLARAALEAAIALRPDLSSPRRLLAEIEFDVAPETPFVDTGPRSPVEDRVILVGIAEQRMSVFDGDDQVFDFVVSTGEPGRDTAIGEFEIQNKIDMAYASTWNLDMPFWMGIYWSGPLQNGIHSLPIVKHTGDKLWDGYLGQRVSYGCVILSDEDAATLYEWTEVGTQVKIVPSLTNWSPEE